MCANHRPPCMVRPPRLGASGTMVNDSGGPFGKVATGHMLVPPLRGRDGDYWHSVGLRPCSRSLALRARCRRPDGPGMGAGCEARAGSKCHQSHAEAFCEPPDPHAYFNARSETCPVESPGPRHGLGPCSPPPPRRSPGRRQRARSARLRERGRRPTECTTSSSRPRSGGTSMWSVATFPHPPP